MTPTQQATTEREITLLSKALEMRLGRLSEQSKHNYQLIRDDIEFQLLEFAKRVWNNGYDNGYYRLNPTSEGVSQ